MPASILQTYLRLNLLDLGSEDSRLHKLEAAASELAESFSQKPKAALPIFLAVLCFDQEVDDAFANVQSAIEKQWLTYHGAYKDSTATTLYRAVAMQALFEAIEIQPVLGTAISLLMRNFSSLPNVGKNKAALDLLVHAANKVFKAESLTSMPYLEAPKFTEIKIGTPMKLDRTAMKRRIDAAVGPQNINNEPGVKPNPHWSNDVPNWSYQFSERMTAILADYIDTAVSSTSGISQSDLSTLNNNLYEVFTKRDAALKMSTSLLWWRQALYSESAEQPYRYLPPIDIVAHAAFDLSALIPAAYEHALESFLMEAILSLLPTEDEISVQDLIKVAEKASSKFSDVVEDKIPTGLLLSAIEHNDASLCLVQASLPPQRWAVWLLRELKALQALNNPKPIPEKGDEDE